ncbi:MAG: hypothetical protein RLZZ618_3298 [Pseudomonadota bacterium]|jgi:NadR type nicotinamide-nucleotide adenylyltransferase
MNTRRFKLGLVVGKFSPLHRGHQWLIEQAAAQCETLLLLSYSSPEFPQCSSATRERWLNALYGEHEVVVLDEHALAERCARCGVPLAPMPTNQADDSTQQHWLGWLLRDVLQRSPDAMFASEAYLVPCATVLSEWLGHTVTPVMGDLHRTAVPIGATAIRQHPSALLAWLPPVVRADVVPRLVMLGGESTGKTTLARALADHLQTVWVAEYGRELWEQQDGELSEADLLKIGLEQVRREDEAAQHASPVLVCDTSPLTTLGYSLWRHGRADARLQALATRRYALAVLCEDDIPFVQDGTRQDAAFRDRQQAWYRDQLSIDGTPWITVSGSVPERISRVMAAWQQLNPAL